jgi:GDPmannose 4,6-dehydratase
MKRALVTGITGQDGAYLSQLLLQKGYSVFGAYRRASDLKLDRLKFLKIADQIEYIPLELLELTNIQRVLDKIKPDEIYNLGAQSFVQLSFEQPLFTADVTAMGPLRILEIIRTLNPAIRFYQASSSEMFGKVCEIPQNENTPFHPRSPYAISKLFAHWATVNYRESYGLFACSGIAFNHESPLRGQEFVTRKITRGVAGIKLGFQNEIKLGNLDAKRDWGYAREYVEAMWLMLQQELPDDYIVATGQVYSVKDFVELAFRQIGMTLAWSGKNAAEKGIDTKSGKTVVSVDPAFFRPAEVDFIQGDSSKARKQLGWSPRTKLDELVSMMVEHDLKLIKQEQNI